MTSWRRLPIGLALAAVILALARVPPRMPALLAAAPAPVRPTNGQALAKALCIACHKVPDPDILPRASWRPEIQKMAAILAGKWTPEGGGPAATVPLSEQYEAIAAYYEAAAPPALPPLPVWPAPDDRPLRFVRHTIAFKDALTPEPAVANVRLADLDGDGRLDLLACDMRQGVVLQARPDHPEAGAVAIAQIPNPDHVSVVDLDKDGRLDLLVSDLGAFFPGDHERGSVTWLRALPGGGYVPFTIGGFPRVADAEAVDAGSGRPDIAVAAFGLHAKGRSISSATGRPTGASPSSSVRSSIRARGRFTSCPRTSTGTARSISSPSSPRSTKRSWPSSATARAALPRRRRSTPLPIRTGDRQGSRSWTSTRTATSTS
jgi:mono/diheme cytochrome c family protein